VEPLSEMIDKLKELIKSHHVERLQSGECSIQGGVHLFDLINSFERISSHSANVALHIIKRVSNNRDFDEMHGHANDSFSEEYKAMYHYYTSQYVEPLTRPMTEEEIRAVMSPEDLQKLEDTEAAEEAAEAAKAAAEAAAKAEAEAAELAEAERAAKAAKAEAEKAAKAAKAEAEKAAKAAKAKKLKADKQSDKKAEKQPDKKAEKQPEKKAEKQPEKKAEAKKKQGADKQHKGQENKKK